MSDVRDWVLERVNDLVTERRLELSVVLPKGTQEATVDGTRVSVLDFFVLASAMRTVFVRMVNDMGGPECVDAPGFLDELWAMARADCLDALGGDED